MIAEPFASAFENYPNAAQSQPTCRRQDAADTKMRARGAEVTT